MSGGFGYYDGGMYDENDGQSFEPGPGAQQAPQQRNPLRDHLKKVEDQNEELRKQVQQLVQQQNTNTVADALQAKGYDRGAAALYGGDPAKLDEWLATNGAYLAKSADTSAQGGEGQQQQGVTSTVPAETQAAMQQMQQAGTSAAAPQGTEAEQMAQINSQSDPAALMQYLQSQGNQHYWNG
jgi:uncharacterized protein YaaQ